MPIDLEAVRATIAAHDTEPCISMQACCDIGNGEVAKTLIAEVERLTTPHEGEISFRCWPKEEANLPSPPGTFTFLIDMACLQAGWNFESRLSPRWIPVTERLPESNCSYLTSNGVGVFEADFVNGAWYSLDERYPFITDITHWMPLPEPPK